MNGELGLPLCDIEGIRKHLEVSVGNDEQCRDFQDRKEPPFPLNCDLR